MHYSISNRFRGTFLGTAVGSSICTSSIEPILSYPDQLQNSSGSLQSTYPHNQDFPWERLAVVTAKSLIQLGRFDVDNWRNNYIAESQTNLALKQNSNNNSLKAIITALPIILFYHENETKLRQNLHQLLSELQDETELAAGVLAVGYAISQSLQEKLNPPTLIPQILTFIGTQLQITKQLATVQILLKQRASLDQAIAVIGTSESAMVASRSRSMIGEHTAEGIALAFYCFLSSVQDLRLAVMRAAKINHHPQLISMITGALSGAYHGNAGIPVNLQLALERDHTLTLWGMTSTAQMLYLSDSLLAVWSGMMYNPDADAIMPLTAIAAPKIIRPR